MLSPGTRVGLAGAWLLCALVAGACSKTPVKAPPDLAPEPFRPQIVFSTTEEQLEQGVHAANFEFLHLRDLWVRVTVPGMPRLTTLTITFLNPLGEEFYADTSYYSPDSTMQEIFDPTAGHMMPVFLAKTIAGGFALDRPIPIGGNTFVRIPIPDGTWEVRAVAEGVPGVLAAALQVVLSR